jgi:signal recognition particle GTPase
MRKKPPFTLSDLLEQMKQLQGKGPLGQVLGMIPGVKVNDEDAHEASGDSSG